jgi:hypothetical protein
MNLVPAEVEERSEFSPPVYGAVLPLPPRKHPVEILALGEATARAGGLP